MAVVTTEPARKARRDFAAPAGEEAEPAAGLNSSCDEFECFAALGIEVRAEDCITTGGLPEKYES
ncbi:MAG TPA: hypothetical protein VFS42_05280, partial [Burkholderiaceae bacterium]|nr:hypothetical protein [Burkholderiaceae bacterium]